MCDRSSRPRISPRTTPTDKRERIIALRRNYRLPYPEIARRTGVSSATVGRIFTQAAVAKLPSLETSVPKRRYERKTPGEILHLDTKKLARFAHLRHYRALGVRVTGIMPDNGSAYRSKKFAQLLRRLKIRHLRTRPYTPRTNGKAERYIQTLLREWAYAYAYPN